ncbi:MAG: ATP-binding protein [Flammeovirgaceae bacterium]|nr:ATP-binding protein [Flammeovirgaceae bacterium]
MVDLDCPDFYFFSGEYLSQLTVVPTGTILFYFPIALSIVLIHWWGLRVIAGLLINSLLDFMFFPGSTSSVSPFTLFHETATAFASWYLFTYRFKGNVWLPDLQQTLFFLFLGIIVPVSVNSVFIFFFGQSPDLTSHVVMVWTADFASSFALTLPALFFLTPIMEQWGLTLTNGSNYIRPIVTYRLLRPYRAEIILSGIALILLSVFVPIEKYWYLYGVFALYISVRFGFSNAILANLIAFIFMYIIPFFTSAYKDLSWALETDLINVHLGMCLLSVIAAIIGRVISDLKIAETKLNSQYRELERTHEELDRFVYSASHDLSAPLKSVMGLINVSRMEKSPEKYSEYLDKMETSIQKLDHFIHEILDYSRNSRLEVNLEVINLPKLTDEIIDNFKFMENVNQIEFDTNGLEVPEITGDRTRTKIILNNLLSNAIKYQRFNNNHTPVVRVRSELNHEYVLIHVEDNGHGIQEDAIGKIFKMFYRGTSISNGSGLGLYIAKEAVEKLDGKIEVKTEYGKGSVFTVYLKKLNSTRS